MKLILAALSLIAVLAAVPTPDCRWPPSPFHYCPIPDHAAATSPFGA